MKISLKRSNQAFHFIAQDSEGRSVHIDANPAIGGEGKGSRPMELLLMGIGGCASIDLGLILKKQRQIVEEYSVDVSAVRHENTAKDLKEVELHFRLKGEIEPEQVEKAVQLTLEKYCSVLLSLHPDIAIEHKITLEKS